LNNDTNRNLTLTDVAKVLMSTRFIGDKGAVFVDVSSNALPEAVGALQTMLRRKGEKVWARREENKAVMYY